MLAVLVRTLSQIFAKVSGVYRLTAVLRAGDRRDDLRHNRAGNLKTLWTLNQFSVHHRTIIKHIPNINQTAVKNRLNKIIHIVEMKHTFFMRFRDFLRKKNTLCQIF